MSTPSSPKTITPSQLIHNHHFFDHDDLHLIIGNLPELTRLFDKILRPNQKGWSQSKEFLSAKTFLEEMSRQRDSGFMGYIRVENEPHDLAKNDNWGCVRAFTVVINAQSTSRPLETLLWKIDPPS